MRKVVIIGAGHVGTHCGLSLMFQGEADEIVYIDLDKTKSVAQALDLDDAVSSLSKKVIVRSGDYSDCKDAQIVVMAAGKTRLPGQTRLDMFEDSINIMKNIIPNLKNSGFNGILISISNPADIIADFLRKKLDMPKNKVFSTGTALDSCRLRRIISQKTNIDRNSIQAFSMGEHGDSQIVPFSNINICGKPFVEFAKQNNINLEEIQLETRKAGITVIDGKGSTEFGIGAVLCEIVKAIFRDEHKIMPVSPLLEGEYGQFDIHAGVPAIIGKNGIEKIIEINLTDEEKQNFDKSCDIIKSYIKMAEKM